MTQSTITITYALYRCKTCGKTQRRSYPTRTQLELVESRFAGMGSETREITRYRNNGVWNTFVPALRCCSAFFGIFPVIVRAEFKANIPCGAKCNEAKGPECHCSCGGEHHGEAWAMIAAKL